MEKSVKSGGNEWTSDVTSMGNRLGWLFGIVINHNDGFGQIWFDPILRGLVELTDRLVQLFEVSNSL